MCVTSSDGPNRNGGGPSRCASSDEPFDNGGGDAANGDDANDGGGLLLELDLRSDPL